MDSKTVNSHIKKRIWPLLRDAGFKVFTSRTAWRHGADRIDVLNFQSFNSYNAGVLGCTTYSFSVNLGCFLLAIPPQYEPSRMKSKDGCLLPQEYECHFRGQLARSFEQPELKRPDIWYIDPGEKYLGWSMTDVAGLIGSRALPWFQKFADPEFALSVLLNEDERMPELWGFGRNPCPTRHYFAGYLAIQREHFDLAHEHLNAALESKCFEMVKDRLARDVLRTDEAMQLERR
jgi:hypothetical protein